MVNVHVFLLVLFLAGCVTAPKIDWASRVGHYTFDQAVIELGPPDKQQKLGDGTLVAEWLTRRGHVFSFPSYHPYWYGGPFYPSYNTSSWPDVYLRLIFDEQGKLKAWKKFTK